LKKVLETLINLQEIDCKLQKLEKAKGNLPQKVTGLKEEIKVLEENITSDKQTLEENQQAMAATNNELSLLRERLAKYQKQLYQVNTNKEYDAITIEIETAEKNIEEKDFEILEREETEKTLLEKLANAEETLNQKMKLLKEMEDELNNRLAVTNDEQMKLTSQREDVITGLSPQLLSNYERIRLAKNGIALALLSNGACSECSSRIPAQRAMEIRQMDRIFLCEVCGRILVWRPEAESVCQV